MLHSYLFYQMNQLNQHKIKLNQLMKYSQFIHLDLEMIMIQKILSAFFVIWEIELLDEFFADAFGGLISVVGKEIEIEIKSYSTFPFENIRLLFFIYQVDQVRIMRLRSQNLNLINVLLSIEGTLILQIQLMEYIFRKMHKYMLNSQMKKRSFIILNKILKYQLKIQSLSN